MVCKEDEKKNCREKGIQFQAYRVWEGNQRLLEGAVVRRRMNEEVGIGREGDGTVAFVGGLGDKGC